MSLDEKWIEPALLFSFPRHLIKSQLQNLMLWCFEKQRPQRLTTLRSYEAKCEKILSTFVRKRSQESNDRFSLFGRELEPELHVGHFAYGKIQGAHTAIMKVRSGDSHVAQSRHLKLISVIFFFGDGFEPEIAEIFVWIDQTDFLIHAPPNRGPV